MDEDLALHGCLPLAQRDGEALERGLGELVKRREFRQELSLLEV